MVDLACCHPHHPALWFPAYAGMTGTVQYDGPVWLVLSCFTLTFDSSPIKGEGDVAVDLALLLPAPHAAPLDCGSSP